QATDLRNDVSKICVVVQVLINKTHVTKAELVDRSRAEHSDVREQNLLRIGFEFSALFRKASRSKLQLSAVTVPAEPCGVTVFHKVDPYGELVRIEPAAFCVLVVSRESSSRHVRKRIKFQQFHVAGIEPAGRYDVSGEGRRGYGSVRLTGARIGVEDGARQTGEISVPHGSARH